jgi:hypothetical protein
MNLEKAVGTAKHAKHAKIQRMKAETRFTKREKGLVRSLPSSLAYFAYFAVVAAGFRRKSPGSENHADSGMDTAV